MAKKQKSVFDLSIDIFKFFVKLAKTFTMIAAVIILVALLLMAMFYLNYHHSP